MSLPEREYRVTGLLLYKDGNFMQLLGGERATVETLYTKISRDPRHRLAPVDSSKRFRTEFSELVDGIPGFKE